MIQNSAFGNIEKLPFDLRGRRILQYHLDSTIEGKADEKNKLKKQLTGVFQEALKHYNKDYITKEKIVWWGNWSIESKIKIHGGKLLINRVSSDAFFFRIIIWDGARSGQISGKAQIVTPHSAYTRIKSFDDQDCEIIFRRRLENGEWFIEIEEGDGCKIFHGHNSTFSGHYKHLPEMVINYGYLDELDLNEIERMTGKYLSVFLDNFQQFSIDKDEEDNELVVITAGVKGLYTIMESIVVLNKFGNIWCAFIDPKIDSIRYFTNLTSQDKPKSMKDWLSKLAQKQIIENDDNEQDSNFDE
jgi:hypothetical protein